MSDVCTLPHQGLFLFDDAKAASRSTNQIYRVNNAAGNNYSNLAERDTLREIERGKDSTLIANRKYSWSI